MGTFTFPRTKTAKSVGHFLKTPFPVSAHELRQVCLQRSLTSAPLPGMCLYSCGNKNDTGHKADRVDRLKASRPFHEDQWPFDHKGPVRCGFFFFYSFWSGSSWTLDDTLSVSGLLSDFYSCLCYSPFFSLLSQVGFFSDHSTKVESKYKYVNCHSLSSVFWWSCDVAFSYLFFYHFPSGLGKMITTSATDLWSSSTVEVALRR